MNQDKDEMRVFLSMSKHIIVNLYFSINTFVIKELAGINSQVEQKEQDLPLIKETGD